MKPIKAKPKKEYVNVTLSNVLGTFDEEIEHAAIDLGLNKREFWLGAAYEALLKYKANKEV